MAREGAEARRVGAAVALLVAGEADGSGRDLAKVRQQGLGAGEETGQRSMLPSRSSRIDGEAGRNNGGHGAVEKFLEREREVTVRRDQSRRER